MIVRFGGVGDIQRIISGIEHFVSVSSYSSDYVDREHVAQTIEALIESEDGLVAILETLNHDFAGCFLGLAHAHLFSGARMMGELFIYTTPDARGHGSKLRHFAEEWARKQKCEAFNIAHPMSEKHLEKVYRRWGFEPHEVHFRKVLKCQ